MGQKILKGTERDLEDRGRNVNIQMITDPQKKDKKESEEIPENKNGYKFPRIKARWKFLN